MKQYEFQFWTLAMISSLLGVVFAIMGEMTATAIMWACIIFMYWESHRKQPPKNDDDKN